MPSDRDSLRHSQGLPAGGTWAVRDAISLTRATCAGKLPNQECESCRVRSNLPLYASGKGTAVIPEIASIPDGFAEWTHVLYRFLGPGTGEQR